ncbi:hypothetical protein E2P81_ATG04899 [Venturia nashicola]|nr:hypothetical protein E2P81_ATG04899 [Venturia nashicola]
MRRLDTQEHSIGRFKEEGRRARAEVSREPTGDKDLAFELETMVMNLKHVSETGVVDSVGGESLRAMFGGREAVAGIPREEAWRTIGSSLADDDSIAGGVLNEPLVLRRRA